MFSEAMLLEQNKRLREENEELRETVRQLRSSDGEEPLPPGLPYLTKKEEIVIRGLLRRRGTVSREQLYTDLYGHNGEVEIHIIDVFVSHIRGKLEQGSAIAIETVWGRGYRIVNHQLTQVNEQLRDVVEAGVSSNSEQRAA
jgi:DNA-binding winged helix-turn-helix (wHTH) protein